MSDGAWPPPDLERLAAAAEELAERLAEPELRAQAFGLAAVIRSLGREEAGEEERATRRRALAAAVETGDEGAAVAELRRLAALDRGQALAVDWSKVTGG